ncbi:MAG TPA: ABC transporter permease [Streptosporangiaceae bacterium]|nr:ABC transporter permease [Streptosporangiaceae bacterium]
MIPLGLRLMFSGGREAITRLIVLTAAVGLGVGLLLTAVAATNAVTTWNNRHAWFWTGTAALPQETAMAGVAPLWWRPSGDSFGRLPINRFDVAATGSSSPVPPGLARDPAPGEYYASPALAALLHSTAPTELADRYPGHLAGTIGDAGLPSPNSLVIIIGRTPATLAHTPGTVPVTSIAQTLPASGPDGRNGAGLHYNPPDGGGEKSAIDLILSVVALAILAPVLIFIATATRLSAARREQRFAAMRLVGATRKQVSQLAAMESTVAGIAGVVAGFGIFGLIRVPVAGIPFIGQPFFPSELRLTLPDILAVAIGVPVAAAAAALLALHRVRITPLGVTRRVTPKPPRAWRVLPMLAGLADIGFFIVHGRPASPEADVLALLPGFLLIIVGLNIAGPWLTMAVAKVMARRTSRPGALIAARRIADDPKAAFRSVSGLVLALLVTTVAVVAITTQDAKNLTRWGSAAETNVVTDQLADASNDFGPIGAGTGPGPAAPAALLAARLRGIPGVEGVLVVRAIQGLNIPAGYHGIGTGMGGPPGPTPAGVISCAQLATVPALGRCPAGAATAAFPADGFNGPLFNLDATAITWPTANVPAVRLAGLRVDAINVATDGSVAAVETTNTMLETSPAYASGSPSSIADLIGQDDSASNAYQQLANTVILVSLPIAGCTLAAGIAAGLADRKRPFSLLRLTGARLAMLRRVVALESAVPLLAGAVVAIGTGFGATAMYANLVMQQPLVAPGPAYYLITAGGILAALGIIAATFPLLARITGPEVARND